MTEGFWKDGDDGRPMYSEENGACGPGAAEPWDRQHTYRDEFIGQVIDLVEDFLHDNADYFRYLDWYAIENGTDDGAILTQRRYDALREKISALLTAWEINV